MIIDIHTHIGEKDHVSSSPRSLLASMREARIDRSVCFALTGNVVEDNTRIHTVSTDSDSITPFYRVNPHEVCPERLEEDIVGFAGVKLHPRGDDFDPVSPSFEPYLDVLTTVNKPVLIHTRKENNLFSDPNHLLALPAEYPGTTFVFAHFANGLPSILDALNKYDNLYLDTSIVSSPAIIEGAVRQVGSHQILFGSDYPLSDQVLEKAKIERASISDEAKHRILGSNASRILGYP